MPLFNQAPAKDVVNVRDYGARGDGVADDTAAIQAAIDSISQSSIGANQLSQSYRFGGKVFLPKGKYRTTSTLYIPAFVELVGQSRPGFANLNQTAVNAPGSIIHYDPTNDATYAVMTGNFVVATGLRKTDTEPILGSEIDDHIYSEARDTCLKDLVVYAAHSGILGGIFFNGAANSRCINVTSVNFATCFKFSACWSMYIEHILAQTSATNGVGVEIYKDANCLTINGCYSTTNQTDGTAYKFSWARGCSFNGMIAESSFTALKEISSTSNAYNGFYAERCPGYIIYINGSTRGQFNGVITTFSPTAPLFYVETSAVGYELHNIFTDSTTFLDKTVGTVSNQIGVKFYDLWPDASEITNIDNDMQVAFYSSAKEEARPGTQFVKTIKMPTTGAAYSSEVYEFEGVKKYEIRNTPGGWGIWDALGVQKLLVDPANSSFYVTEWLDTRYDFGLRVPGGDREEVIKTLYIAPRDTLIITPPGSAANPAIQLNASFVGIGTDTPTKSLEVVGDIKSNTVVYAQTTAPTAAANTSVQWTASGSGTKDGVAYDQGDVLVTSNVGGVSKTLHVLQWGAI